MSQYPPISLNERILKEANEQLEYSDRKLERFGGEIIDLVCKVKTSEINNGEIQFSKNEHELISSYFWTFKHKIHSVDTKKSFENNGKYQKIGNQYYSFAQHEINTLKKLVLLLAVDPGNNSDLFFCQLAIVRFIKSWIEVRVKLPIIHYKYFGMSASDVRNRVFRILSPELNIANKKKERAKEVNQFIYSVGSENFVENSDLSGTKTIIFVLVEEMFELFEGMGKIWVEQLKSVIEISKEYYDDIYEYHYGS
jgi:hypothetical protein